VTRLLGIVLAGGRGRRLGLAVPKALVVAGGCTLIERAIRLLGSLCDELVVCAPADLDLPVDAALRVADAAPGSGPLGALVTALGSRPHERAIVLGVDLPFMTRDVLRAIASGADDAPAVVPAPAGRPQPLAARYAPRAHAPLAAAFARGERALVPAVLALGPRLVPDAELAALPGGTGAFLNLNTPGDLAEAGRRFAAGEAA